MYRFLLFLILGFSINSHSAGLSGPPNSQLDFARWAASQRAGIRPAAALQRTVTNLPMADGVRLYTSTYLPGTGKYPCILIRTPYNGIYQGEDFYTYRGIADYYGPRGYAVIIQTIRGKYLSEGSYRLLSSGEIDDGYDTIQWISRQSWCDGNIAAMGVSHDGFTALAAGVRNPPGLKVILSGGAPADLRTDAFIVNGVVTTGMIDYIAYITNEYGIPYEPIFYETYLEKVLREPRLRLHDNKVKNKQLVLWDQLIPQLNRPNSVFWKQRRIRDRLQQIQAPVVHIAGLTEDGDMPDTVSNFVHMTRTPEIKARQRLILGWWNHSGSGPYADLSNISPYLLDRYNAYLDFYLKGIPSPLINQKPVQVYSKGQEKWIDSDRWPLVAGSEQTTFYLSSGGKLARKPQSAGDQAAYKTDPQSIPTFLDSTILVPGPDQLVFLSDPFTKDTSFVGEGALRFFASSSTKDTDFIALLLKRGSSGEDEFFGSLTARIQARYRNGGYQSAQLLIPGQIVEYNVTIPVVSGKIKKGERLVLLILSNLNPFFVRNAQSGKPIGTDQQFHTARQQIHFGGPYTSTLTIPARR